MKINSILKAWLGGLLILVGVLIGLAFSGSAMWSELEARLYTFYTGDRSFGIHCPLMLAPGETGTVQATIANLTNDNITPQVSIEISHLPLSRKSNQTVSLPANASQSLEWTVTSDDVVYQRLILVSVWQLRYRDNPSRLGSCGILWFNLFGLSGTESADLILTVSLLAMFLGAWMWLNARHPLDEISKNLARIGATLISITLFALLSALLRWWGLTLFFDALILLVVGVIVSDFSIFSQKQKG